MKKETNEVSEPFLQFNNGKTRSKSKRIKIVFIVCGVAAVLVLILGLGLGLGLKKEDSKENELIECAENVRISSVNIKEINYEMFKNCVILKKITFDDKTNVTKIGARAFIMSTIEEIHIPKTVTTIEKYAFYGSDLKRIYFKGSQLSIVEEGTFMYSNLEMISLPETIEVIEDRAFESCGYLEGVSFSNENNNNLKIIGKRAFYKCDKLSAIEQLPALQSIGDFAFAETSLAVFTCYSSLEVIGDYAFKGASLLTMFDTGDCTSLETINSYSFYDTKIEQLIIPDCVKNIADSAFGSSSRSDQIKYVEFPAKSQIKSLDPSAFINRIYKVCVLTLDESIRNYIRNTLVRNINVTEECEAD